jgi:nucleoside 2-deoxyribosyltransferase
MRDIFITSTFRNDWNRRFNFALEQALVQEGFTCFLPQRDSDQSGDRKQIYAEDVAGIERSKLMVAVGIKTQTANWGFEIGYATQAKKPVIVITDPQHPVELMCEGAASEVLVVENIDDIPSYVKILADLARKWLPSN